jgi:phosphate transport system protein
MRAAFQHELEQLRIQVELMAVRVGENVERMRRVLEAGDEELAEEALRSDDDIDAMLVSLTERTYDLLRRESPVAADLRFCVSALRVLEELERIGDLSLRVVKRVDDHERLAAHPALFETLDAMAGVAQEQFKVASGAWSAQDLSLACTLADRTRAMETHYDKLMDAILRLDGPDAAQVAVAAVLVGRALDRIADHAVIIGERLRYLLTGDPAHLASEAR